MSDLVNVLKRAFGITNASHFTATGSWSPRNATVPLLAWYRADSAVQAVGVVSSWPDQSGSGDANRNQIVGAGSPTYNAADAGFGGKPSVSSDSTAYFLSAGPWSTLPARPITIVVVGKASTSSFLSTDAGGYDLLWQTGSTIEFYNSGFGNFIDAPGALPSATPGVIMFEDAGGVAANATKLYTNNLTTPVATEISCYTTPSGRLNLMFPAAGVNALNGSEAEVMVFAGVLSAADRLALANYLNVTRAYGIAVTT